MANRPRRSKAGDKVAPATIDLAAEEQKLPDSEPDANLPAPADPNAAPVAADLQVGASDAAPLANKPVPDAALANKPVADAALADKPKPAAPKPAPAPQKPAAPVEQTAQAAKPMSASETPATGSPARGPVEAREESATEKFAAEEGFTRPLSASDLAEFEDDETVLAAAEPDPAPEVAPYRDPEIVPAPATTGSLIGAGVIGSVLSLLAGGALLYSGILPGVPSAQPTASQFASAGEVQRLSGDLATLNSRVEQMQSAQAAGGAGSSSVSATDFAALSDRVAAGERRMQSGTAESGDLAAALATAGTDLQAVRETVETTREAAATATDTANSANAAATAARDSADRALADVTAFEQRLTGMEAANRQAAAALAAAALKAAIDRGGPFMSELEAYAAAGPDNPGVDALRDSAAGGVKSLAALQAEWPTLERQLLLVVRPADANANVGDQLLSGLRSLVTVRPEGESAATAPGPEGAIGRMDNALESGNLTEFLAEQEALPQAAKDASASFAAQVAARQSANALIDDVLGGVIAASGQQN
ncbi:hypothetical protein FPY71_14270 [Aureimonas fodinaquatilis]|uniref:Phage tail protein n=1 Tax=Aureimonas fodinaquatilis TaxID=2565783 RepID=A0A5B0DV59_9HYPH|nr:hypothetical protein [Aureimonas fodinaquatilis]KAA0969681.1 hypothetical protein FPY71_14270 [Aureimonas fodinaquatilis]